MTTNSNINGADTAYRGDPELLPVRMLNEFAYCPRLFHLEHVQGQWEDNVFTEEGRWVHRRVDGKIDAVLEGPAPESAREMKQGPEGDGAREEPGDPAPEIHRSVTLGSERFGIVSKLDLVATEGQDAVPVETKRGRVPNNEERSWEPERVQLMAQGLLLREHGYRSTRGVLYFAGSRTRVDVPFTEDLERRTLRFIAQARATALQADAPAPLDDSPKCWGCSLSGICLPDEVNALTQADVEPAAREPRRLFPAKETTQSFYVQEPGAKVGKTGESLVVKKEGKQLARVGLKEVSELVLLGRVGVSAQAIHLLCEKGRPIIHMSGGHWFYGVTQGMGLRNAYDRAAQFAAADDEHRRLMISRKIVAAKGANQRTLLRRNGLPSAQILDKMRKLIGEAGGAPSIEHLRGLEGNIARLYFSSFQSMLRPRSGKVTFSFTERNRRPPKDPVNAMLSFGYALLAKDCTIALLAVGLDPWWGLFHAPRHGRPALALDLMEEFRPLVVDSAVVTAVNTGALDGRHFISAASGCALTNSGRKRFIKTYAARMEQLVTHPVFDYRCSWRQVLKLQARLLAKHLRGEIDDYVGMVTR